MSVLKPLPWQQELWLQLTSQLLSGGLHHALLLAGPQGVGKRHFAKAFAAFLMCEQRSGYACGQCRSCQQLAAGTQANASLLSVDGHTALSTAESAPEQLLRHWEPDKDSKRRDIAVKAVRSFIDHLALASHYGQGRVALIDPAETLNDASVNAFLKTIEEPTPGTHLIFVSEQPNLLKATLRSRCHKIRMPVPPAEQARAWLEAQGARDAARLLEAAHGAPLRALAWLKNDRAQVQEHWREWMEKLAQHKADPLTVAADVGKADAADFLAWFTADLASRLRLLVGQGKNATGLARFTQTLSESQRRLDGNAKPELLLDALMIQWWALHRVKKSIG